MRPSQTLARGVSRVIPRFAAPHRAFSRFQEQSVSISGLIGNSGDSYRQPRIVSNISICFLHMIGNHATLSFILNGFACHLLILRVGSSDVSYLVHGSFLNSLGSIISLNVMVIAHLGLRLNLFDVLYILVIPNLIKDFLLLMSSIVLRWYSWLLRFRLSRFIDAFLIFLMYQMILGDGSQLRLRAETAVYFTFVNLRNFLQMLHLRFLNHLSFILLF